MLHIPTPHLIHNSEIVVFFQNANVIDTKTRQLISVQQSTDEILRITKNHPKRTHSYFNYLPGLLHCFLAAMQRVSHKWYCPAAYMLVVVKYLHLWEGRQSQCCSTQQLKLWLKMFDQAAFTKHTRVDRVDGTSCSNVIKLIFFACVRPEMIVRSLSAAALI